MDETLECVGELNAVDESLQKILIEQLAEDLEHYGFNKKQWYVKRGPGFAFEGHFCTNCGIDDHSGLLIVNKNNEHDRFEGVADWVHVKTCEPLGSSSRVPNEVIFRFYWDLITGNKDMARKYQVQLKEKPGVPEYLAEFKKLTQ